MEPEIILFICAGCLFAFLLFLYTLIAFESRKRDKRYTEKLLNTYSKDNVRKMEYDTAYYDKKAEWFINGEDAERQVTFDDLLNENGGDVINSDKALFVHLEAKGIEDICGNYEPGNDK